MANVREHSSTIPWFVFGELVNTWFLLLKIDLGLRFSSFQSVQKKLAPDSHTQEIARSEQISTIIQRQRWLVNLASHYHFFNMTCLRRALAFQTLLARRGIIADLRFGVRLVADKLEAHAWLEYNGVLISEPEAITGRFAALANQNSSRDP